MNACESGRGSGIRGSRRPGWRLSAALAVWCLVAVSACVTTSGTQPGLAEAAGVLAGDLARQLGPQLRESELLVIDPILDRATGQRTGATLRLQEELRDSLAAELPEVELTGLDTESVDDGRLVLTGTLMSMPDSADLYSASVALSDRDIGIVVAQSAVRFREGGLDRTPTAFYDDSPSLTRDRSVEGYITTAETPKGEQADALYIEQLPTAALLAEANAAYEAERWEQARTYYEAVSERPDGQNLRTFNGLYLTNLRLGRTGEAEEAFSRIVELGLATDNLAVKLLFRPGSTDFWPNAEVSGMYPMWLRRIAQAAESSGSCLEILGHTSRSGSAELNERLSLQRAERVRQLLIDEAGGDLAGQLDATGVGFSENIIGTGADDATDAIDRRVEFSVVPCGGA